MSSLFDSYLVYRNPPFSSTVISQLICKKQNKWIFWTVRQKQKNQRETKWSQEKKQRSLRVTIEWKPGLKLARRSWSTCSYNPYRQVQLFSGSSLLADFLKSKRAVSCQFWTPRISIENGIDYCKKGKGYHLLTGMTFFMKLYSFEKLKKYLLYIRVRFPRYSIMTCYWCYLINSVRIRKFKTSCEEQQWK